MRDFLLQTTRFGRILLASGAACACSGQLSVKGSDGRRSAATTAEENAGASDDGSDQVDGVTDQSGTGNQKQPADPGGEKPSAGQPPVATLSGTPLAVDSADVLAVTVAGAEVATYARDLRPGDVSCPETVPASFQPVTILISDALSGSGAWTLCVWGKTAGGLIQSAATKYTWVADLDDPFVTPSAKSAFVRADVSGGQIVLTATAGDDESGLAVAAISVAKSGTSTCLNADKSAFDVVCPQFHTISSGSALSFSLPESALSHGESYTATWRVQDAVGLAATASATFSWNASVSLYMGIQTSGGSATRVEVFSYFPGDNSITRGTPVDLSSRIAAGDLRSMDMLADGSLVAGGGSALATAIIAVDGTVSAGPTFSGGGTPLSNVHGICALPNGNYIAGHYAYDKVNEYQPDGSFVREVYAITVTALTACKATAADTLYLIDYDANNDNDGDLVKLTLANGVWTEQQRFDQSAVVGNSSSIYSFVVHSSGDIYALPQNPAGARNKEMIKCPGGDLSACALTGHDVHGATSGFLQGLAQIPGADDLVLANDEKMFRYNISTGALTEIYNVSTLPNVSQIRHLKAR
jgi:hypothetical protein